MVSPSVFRVFIVEVCSGYVQSYPMQTLIIKERAKKKFNACTCYDTHVMAVPLTSHVYFNTCVTILTLIVQ